MAAARSNVISSVAAAILAVVPGAHALGPCGPQRVAPEAVVATAPPAKTGPAGILAVGSAPVPGAGKAYMGTVTLIDTANNSIVRAVKISAFPDALAVAPDGQTVYVAATGPDDLGLPGTFRTVKAATGVISRAINVGTAPTAVAVSTAASPSGDRIFVACGFDAATQPPSGSVWALNAALQVDGSPRKVAAAPVAMDISANSHAGIVVGSSAVTLIHPSAATVGPDIDVQASGVALSPNGKTAYLAGHAKDQPIEVIPVNFATGTKEAEISTGASVAAALAISPDGKTLFVVGDPDPGLGATEDTVTVISTPTGRVVKTVSLGVHPGNSYWSILLNPDGRGAYILGDGSASVPGVAIPFNTATLSAGKAITVGDNGGDLAFAPSGKWAYILDEGIQDGAHRSSGGVVPINVRTGAVGTEIPVAGYAQVMAAS
jgi:DNA-binding beta-propeller fold protein YncE